MNNISIFLSLALGTFCFSGVNAAGNLALHLNGTGNVSQRVEISDQLVFDAAADGRESKSLTLSAWLQMSSIVNGTDGVSFILGHRAQVYANANGSMYMGLQNGKWCSNAGAGNVSEKPLGDGTDATVDDWVFITMTYDADTHMFSFYHNGELLSSYDNGKAWALFNDHDDTNSTIFAVGGREVDLNLDEVHVFNRCLSAEEVKNSMSEARGIDGLVALYDFNETLGEGEYPNVATGADACTDMSAYAYSSNTYGWAYTVSGRESLASEVVDGRTISGSEPEPDPEYCFIDGKTAIADRQVQAIMVTVNGETTSTVTVPAEVMAQSYCDATEAVIVVHPGDVLNVQAVSNGTWKHPYFYIDYNRDGEFTPVIDEDADGVITAAVSSELVSFTNYSSVCNALDYSGGKPSTNEKNNTYYNSIGEKTQCRANISDPLPAFTIPANLPSGDYRARFKSDYNHLDACGHPDSPYYRFVIESHHMVDFIIRVEGGAEVSSHTVKAEVITSGEAGGSIYLSTDVEGASLLSTPADVVEGTKLYAWFEADEKSVLSSVHRFVDGVDQGDEADEAVAVTDNLKYLSFVVEDPTCIVAEFVPNSSVGVDSVDAVAGHETEIYTVTGVRVAGKLQPGVYVIVKEGKSSKVAVR